MGMLSGARKRAAFLLVTSVAVTGLAGVASGASASSEPQATTSQAGTTEARWTQTGGTEKSGAAAGPYGEGLKVAKKVIATPVVASIKEPWVVWNNKKCAYEKMTDHPAKYKPVLRKIVSPYQIGYMNYGDIDSFGIANTKNITELAKEAGFTLNVYNTKYPSETEPLTQARASAVKGDKGVITAQQTAFDQAYKILAQDGCIPVVQLYAFGTAVPNFGVNWANAGTQIGSSLAKVALKNGWDPATTALVQCTNPDFGPSVNAMFRTAPPAVKRAGFAVANKNVFNLTCKVGKHETVTTDWFTAHPDYKHIMFDTIDDPSADGMINAIKKAGRQADSIIIVNGADPQGRAAIRAGAETGSTGFFPEKYGEWALAMLEDVLSGVPVPLEVNHPTPLITKANIDKYYPKGG